MTKIKMFFVMQFLSFAFLFISKQKRIAWVEEVLTDLAEDKILFVHQQP